jgi:hypothetical protein
MVSPLISTLRSIKPITFMEREGAGYGMDGKVPPLTRSSMVGVVDGCGCSVLVLVFMLDVASGRLGHRLVC